MSLPGLRRRPRVILDTNLLASFLLPPADPTRTIHQVVRHALNETYTLILPMALVEEVQRTVRAKPYFRQRISVQEAEEFIALIVPLAEIPDPISKIPTLVRDRKDDYLLAHAVADRADFLVSGDRDLLALDGEVDPLRIVTATEFLRMLEPEQQLE